ncbi:MAG: hypothetical protein HY617_00485 [Candidatus Sungbacteria bacterium]|nr:hypothetical protein [Candidatus Sungbacteria bacterium]
MDILDQYNKDKPVASAAPAGRAAAPDESAVRLDGQMYRSRAILGDFRTPKMIVWVMQHSGGALKTERHAAYALLAVACIIGVVSILLFVRGIRGPYTERGPGLTPKELEDYKKIQPF